MRIVNEIEKTRKLKSLLRILIRNRKEVKRFVDKIGWK